jgi:hypothetical protein
MATYNFYDGSIRGTEVLNIATPGDTSTLVIRRGFVDTTKQILNNADVAQVFPVYAGEVIIGAWFRVITADATANLTVDFGIDGAGNFALDALTTPANLCVENFANVLHVAANANVTLSPTNAVAIDTGVFEVVALITKSFSKL